MVEASQAARRAGMRADARDGMTLPIDREPNLKLQTWLRTYASLASDVPPWKNVLKGGAVKDRT